MRSIGFTRLIASLFLLPFAAHAKITVTPVNAGGVVSEEVKRFYYAALTPNDQNLTQAMFDGPSGRYYPVDISAMGHQFGEASASYRNRLLFDVVSDAIPTDGKQLLLTIKMEGQAGARAIPISSVGDGAVACDAQLCQDDDLEKHPPLADGLGARFYAVKYPKVGERLRVGIYPAEACLSYSNESSRGNGCDGPFVSSPTAAPGEATQISLIFSFATAEATGPATGTAEEHAVTLHFQVDEPKFVCPDLTNVYFPGDGEILLKTDHFRVGTGTSQSLATGRAPITELIVVGNNNSSADVSSEFESRNTIRQRLGIGGEHSVPGFENAQDYTENLHEVAFLARDASGMLAPAPSSCKLSGVQTAAIDSFLQKGNCFIATAAFGSADAPPVELLRKFRDKVLLRSSWGKVFVKAYYRHSPGAARWLLENPAFRSPVLLALAPLEAVAWLVLHPLSLLLIFASTGAGGMLLSRAARGRVL